MPDHFSYTDTLIYTTRYCDKWSSDIIFPAERIPHFIWRLTNVSRQTRFRYFAFAESWRMWFTRNHVLWIPSALTYFRGDFQCVYDQFSVDSVILTGQYCDSISHWKISIAQRHHWSTLTTRDSSLRVTTNIWWTGGRWQRGWFSSTISVSQNAEFGTIPTIAWSTKTFNEDTVSVSGPGDSPFHNTRHSGAKRIQRNIMKQTRKISEAGQKWNILSMHMAATARRNDGEVVR